MSKEHVLVGRLGHKISLATFDTLSQRRQREVAETVGRATSQPDSMGEAPQMLPVDPEALYNKFLGVVASIDGEFSGYIGAMNPTEHQSRAMAEVGSLWVEPGMRMHGIGSMLVNTASHLLLLEGIHPYAFCNPHSIGVFERNQYHPATLLDVPLEAGSLCAQCPKLGGRKLGVECCDTVMIHHGDIVGEGQEWTR